MTTIYANDMFALMRDRLIEGDRLASTADGQVLAIADGTTIDTTVDAPFPRLSSACAMLDAMSSTTSTSTSIATSSTPKTGSTAGRRRSSTWPGRAIPAGGRAER